MTRRWRAASARLTLAVSLRRGDLRAWSAFRLGQASYFLGDYPARSTASGRARSSPPASTLCSRRPPDFSVPCSARSWLVYCLAQRGEFGEGLALGEEAVRLAEAVDHPSSLIVPPMRVSGICTSSEGRLPRPSPPSNMACGLCRRWRNLVWFPSSRPPWVTHIRWSGRHAEALPLLEQAMEQEATMGGGHDSAGSPELSQGYLLAGRLEEARVMPSMLSFWSASARNVASRHGRCGSSARSPCSATPRRSGRPKLPTGRPSSCRGTRHAPGPGPLSSGSWQASCQARPVRAGPPRIVRGHRALSRHGDDVLAAPGGGRHGVAEGRIGLIPYSPPLILGTVGMNLMSMQPNTHWPRQERHCFHQIHPVLGRMV